MKAQGQTWKIADERCVRGGHGACKMWSTDRTRTTGVRDEMRNVKPEDKGRLRVLRGIFNYETRGTTRKIAGGISLEGDGPPSPPCERKREESWPRKIARNTKEDL